MNTLLNLQEELRQCASPEKAELLARFFKTDPGEYAEGDQFLGIVVPDARRIAKKNRNLSLDNTVQLLHSPWHEERMVALLILIDQYARGNEKVRAAIYAVYLANTSYINNWDLVDVSAEHIVGAHIANGDADEDILVQLAQSVSVWERRIAMLATFYFIKKGDARLAFAIAEVLIHDRHDLIQKAVGWMLREVGKRCSTKEEEAFLTRFAATMPRTMLRYAVEQLPILRKERYMRWQAKKKSLGSTSKCNTLIQ